MAFADGELDLTIDGADEVDITMVSRVGMPFKQLHAV
jgi:ribose 5-phosphate isomerase